MSTNPVLTKTHQAAHDALGTLMHSDEVTDAQAAEIQQFVLRMHGMMRENRSLSDSERGIPLVSYNSHDCFPFRVRIALALVPILA